MKTGKKKLTRDEVLHLAQLAQLTLTDAEIEKFRTQLSEILSFVSKLDEINTDLVEPTHQVSGLKQITRNDEVQPDRMISQKEAVSQSTHNKDGFFVVPGVFETEEV